MNAKALIVMWAMIVGLIYTWARPPGEWGPDTVRHLDGSRFFYIHYPELWATDAVIFVVGFGLIVTLWRRRAA